MFLQDEDTQNTGTDMAAGMGEGDAAATTTEGGEGENTEAAAE